MDKNLSVSYLVREQLSSNSHEVHKINRQSPQYVFTVKGPAVAELARWKQDVPLSAEVSSLVWAKASMFCCKKTDITLLDSFAKTKNDITTANSIAPKKQIGLFFMII